MPGIFALLDLLFQPIALLPAGDVDQCRHPVEGGEQLVLDRARLDVARPADDHRRAVAAFPGFAFLTLERRDAAVREGDGLGAVVGGEDDDGVVELAHVLELFQHIADVVVHLLHAGFVDAPVLAALLAHHVHILRRQHGRDMHARRIVPDEERLVGLLRVVAVEEVDDLGRDFLVHRFDRFSVSGPSSLQVWFFSVPSEEWHHKTGRGGVRQIVVLGSTAPGTSGTPGIGVFLHGGATACSVGYLLISGKLTCCIASR